MAKQLQNDKLAGDGYRDRREVELRLIAGAILCAYERLFRNEKPAARCDVSPQRAFTNANICVANVYMRTIRIYFRCSVRELYLRHA